MATTFETLCDAARPRRWLIGLCVSDELNARGPNQYRDITAIEAKRDSARFVQPLGNDDLHAAAATLLHRLPA